jgi:3-dehydroquinate dehydratase II
MTSADVTTVLLLNGPNLGQLGHREPDVYGSSTLQEIVSMCQIEANSSGLTVEAHQSDSESELIGWVQLAAKNSWPIIINPGAFTHYSMALRDALVQVDATVIEVHLSQPASRESFRSESVVAPVVDGTISGFGPLSYVLAIRAIAEQLAS